MSGVLRQRLVVVWIVALVVAIGNALVVVRRMPIQQHLAANADEAAARMAARWIAGLPSGSDPILLLSHRDETAFWYGCRVTYYAAPRRLTILWLPATPQALARHSALIAFRTAEGGLPGGWNVQQRAGPALLAVSSTSGPISFSVPAHVARPLGSLRVSRWGRVLAGAVGLGLVVVLGAFALGLTLRTSPFGGWWAKLALAHLSGAAALAWLLQGTALLTGAPRVWPVYVALALLLPGWRRVQRWFVADVAKEVPLISGGSPSLPSTGEERIAGGANGSWQRLTLWEWLLVAVVGLGIVTALERGLLIGLDWDGFMIWQLKAKTFFLEGNLSLLREPRHFPYAHLDYPLLVPLQSWWLYAHFGAANPRWAQVSGLLFYADTLILFGVGAARWLARPYVLMGLALLACLPELTMHAVSGYADLPLAAYFLVLAVCLARYFCEADRPCGDLIPWMLAGIVLTKNEGLLACLSVFLAAGVLLVLGRGHGKSLWKALVVWIAAVACAYLPWWWAKRAWNLTSDLFQPEQAPHFTFSLLAWRFRYALFNGFVGELFRIGPWFPAWGLMVLILPLGGIAALRRRMAICRPLWLLCGLQLLGYIGIYMITPASLPAHVGSSVERLVLHMLPTALLAALLGCFASDTT